MNQYFDKIVCINLLERPDKLESSKKRFANHNIKVEYFHPVIYGFNNIIANSLKEYPSYKGILNTYQPNELGCTFSHYHVIKQALLEGHNSLFIFEDDALLHKDFNQLLDKYMQELPSHWDSIMLYSYMYDTTEENYMISKHLMKANMSWSTLAYGMTREFMEYYIEYQDKLLSVSDMPSYNAQPDNNIFITKPLLCIPSESKSDIREYKNYASETTLTKYLNKSDYN